MIDLAPLSSYDSISHGYQKVIALLDDLDAYNCLSTTVIINFVIDFLGKWKCEKGWWAFFES